MDGKPFSGLEENGDVTEPSPQIVVEIPTEIPTEIPVTTPETQVEIPPAPVEEGISLSGYWPTNISQWSDIIIIYANKFDIDPDMIAAVMTIESRGNPEALSSAGAIGLMQIMPKYHSCASWNPEENVACGTQILLHYYTRAGDWRRGLAAYNAGETGRDLYWRGYGYADLVLAQYNNSKN